MTDTQTNLEKPHSTNTHDYFRGISSCLIFLFTLAAFSSSGVVPRVTCIGAAGLTASAAVITHHLKNKKTR